MAAGYFSTFTLANLKALNTSSAVLAAAQAAKIGYAYVKGLGRFYWDSASTLTANNITVIQVTGVTTGRFRAEALSNYPITFATQADLVALTTDEMSSIYHCFTAEYTDGLGEGGGEWFFDADETSPDGYIRVGGSDDTDGANGCFCKRGWQHGQPTPYDFGCIPGTANTAGLTAFFETAWSGEVTYTTAPDKAQGVYLKGSRTGKAWKIDDTIELSTGFSAGYVRTDGPLISMIDASIPAAAGKVAIKITGSVSGLVFTTIEGFTLLSGDSPTSASAGIQIDGKCGITIKDCIIGGFGTPAWLYNESSGVYGEHAVFEHCYLSGTTVGMLRYTKGSGTNSGRGAGLRDCFTNRTADIPAILVDSGMFPYLAPMSFTIWDEYSGTHSVGIIENNASSPNPTFIGNITIEGINNNVIMGSGNNFTFQGNITHNGYHVDLGTMIVSDYYVATRPDGSTSYTPRPYPVYSDTVATAGDNVTVSLGLTTGNLCIWVNDSNYRWTGEYKFFLNPGDATMSGLTLLASDLMVDDLSRGSPTVTLATDGTLSIAYTNTTTSAGAYGLVTPTPFDPFGASTGY